MRKFEALTDAICFTHISKACGHPYHRSNNNHHHQFVNIIINWSSSFSICQLRHQKTRNRPTNRPTDRQTNQWTDRQILLSCCDSQLQTSLQNLSQWMIWIGQHSSEPILLGILVLEEERRETAGHDVDKTDNQLESRF